jgi:predicted ATPase
MQQLKSISLRNFKCFGPTDNQLKFSKLNILTGSNSSGKSSMIDAILAVCQTVSGFPFRLSPNGKYVVMGDYYEFIRNHDESLHLGIDLEFSDNSTTTYFKTDWVNDESSDMPILNSLNATSDLITLNVTKQESSYLVNFRLSEKDSSKVKLSEIASSTINLIKSFNLPKDDNERTKIEIKDDTYSFTTSNLFSIPMTLISNDLNFAYYAISNILFATGAFSENLNFISSFRIKPERTYTQSSYIENVNPNGDNAISQIFQWKIKKSPKYNALLKDLKSLKLINSLSTIKFKGGRYEVRVKSKNRGAWASLVDVGFGISQFIPIAVANLQLSKGSTLIVDQPELHLHPSAQANLADYFIRKTKENSSCYFLETHSEYLLNRLRSAIVKGKLKESDINIYYFQNEGNSTSINKITFTKDGRILNAPEDFFNTYLMDIVDIAFSATK